MAPGTSSPIHAVHALFPITPNTAASATTPTRTWRAVPAGNSTNGNATIGSQSSREAPIAAIETSYGPTVRVSHAPGTWRICAAKGSAARSPIVNGLARRWSAHAVSTAPPVQAPNSSATAASPKDAQTETRSAERVDLTLSGEREQCQYQTGEPLIDPLWRGFWPAREPVETRRAVTMARSARAVRQAGADDPLLEQGALHGLSVRPRARLLDSMAPEEFPVVLRHRLAHDGGRPLAGKLAAGQHDAPGDRAARAGLERGLLRPVADRPSRPRAERVHVRSADAALSAGALPLSRGAADRAGLAGRSTRLRRAGPGRADGRGVDRPAADLLAHQRGRQHQLGVRTGDPAPVMDDYTVLPGAPDGGLSSRLLCSGQPVDPSVAMPRLILAISTL